VTRSRRSFRAARILSATEALDADGNLWTCERIGAPWRRVAGPVPFIGRRTTTMRPGRRPLPARRPPGAACVRADRIARAVADAFDALQWQTSRTITVARIEVR